MMLSIIMLLFVVLPLVIVIQGFNSKVKSEYIYHVTKPEYAQKIVQNGYANLKGSKGFGSYSNFLRTTCFYFAGVPDRMQLVFNISKTFLKEDVTAVRIRVADLPSNVKMKRRFLDGAVFHTGDLKNVPAEIVTIPSERIPFVLQPVLFVILLGIATGLIAISAHILGSIIG